MFYENVCATGKLGNAFTVALFLNNTVPEKFEAGGFFVAVVHDMPPSVLNSILSDTFNIPFLSTFKSSALSSIPGILLFGLTTLSINTPPVKYNDLCIVPYVFTHNKVDMDTKKVIV